MLESRTRSIDFGAVSHQPPETGGDVVPTFGEIAARRRQLNDCLSSLQPEYNHGPTILDRTGLSGGFSDFAIKYVVETAAEWMAPQYWRGGKLGEPSRLADSSLAFIIARYINGLSKAVTGDSETSSVRQPALAVDTPYDERINELAEIAIEEGISPKTESLQDFLSFVQADGASLSKGALFLLDDGTYKATWRNAKWRIDLTFLGSQRLSYVLLDRSNPPEGEADQIDFKSFSDKLKRWGAESPLTK